MKPSILACLLLLFSTFGMSQNIDLDNSSTHIFIYNYENDFIYIDNEKIYIDYENFHAGNVMEEELCIVVPDSTTEVALLYNGSKIILLIDRKFHYRIGKKENGEILIEKIDKNIFEISYD